MPEFTGFGAFSLGVSSPGALPFGAFSSGACLPGALAAQAGTAPLWDRTLPNSGEAVAASGDINVFNLMFIVGFAILISVLARHLSTRGRRK